MDYNNAPNVIQLLTDPPRPDAAPCPFCGRSAAPFHVRRSALLDTLNLLLDLASEVHDADGRQLLLAIARDAKAAAEEVAL
jgi:hypothetical protein